MPRPFMLTYDILTLKVASESRVTYATSVPILVFLGLSVLDLGPMYATDRRQTSDAHHRLMPPAIEAGAQQLTSPNLKTTLSVKKLHPFCFLNKFAKSRSILIIFGYMNEFATKLSTSSNECHYITL